MTTAIRQKPPSASVDPLPPDLPDWTRQNRGDFWALSGAITLVGLALGTVLPLTVLRLEQSGHGSALVGVLMALHALGLILAMPLTPIAVTDRSPRRALCLSSLGAALVCMAMQDAVSVPALATALLVLGVLLGVVFNVVETWINAILPEHSRGRWLAVHCSIFTVFQLCGPLLLQVLPAGHEYRLSGGLLLVTLPACGLLSARRLDDEGESGALSGGLRMMLSAPAVVWGTVLFALVDTLVLGLLPLYGRLEGLSPSDALLSASVVLAGDTALEWVIGALADRHGCVPLQVVCGLVLLLASVLLPFAIGHATWWPLLFAIGGAAGGIYVLSLMASGQRFSGRGLLRMTALLGASWGVASCSGPLMTGLLMQVNLTWALPGILTVSAAILLLALAWEAAQCRIVAAEVT